LVNPILYKIKIRVYLKSELPIYRGKSFILPSKIFVFFTFGGRVFASLLHLLARREGCSNLSFIASKWFRLNQGAIKNKSLLLK
jgi:hypothetical protein